MTLPIPKTRTPGFGLITLARDYDRERWVKPLVAAQHVGVCLETVYDVIHAGQLAALRVGRQWRVRLSDVESCFQHGPSVVRHQRTA